MLYSISHLRRLNRGAAGANRVALVAPVWLMVVLMTCSG